MRINFERLQKLATLYFTLLIILATNQAFSQCSVDAGSDFSICDGEEINLSAVASGGDGNYTYFWNVSFGFGANQTFTPIGSASQNLTHTYSVTVLDGSGCSNTDDVVVKVKSNPSASSVVTQPTCANPGEITISFANHPNRSAIKFSLDGGNSYEANVPDNSGSVTYPVNPGTHDIYTKWGNNECPVFMETVTVNPSPGPSMDLGNGFRGCDGEPITFTPNTTGGSSPYTYVWDNGTDSGTGLSVTLNGSSIANQNQTFVVTATDANGCVAADNITINVRSNPNVTVSHTDRDCFTDGSMTFSFFNHPSRSGIEFSVNGGSSYISGVNDNSGSVTYLLDPGTYPCISRWGNNECPTDLGSITIMDNGGISLDVGSDIDSCDGEILNLSPTISGETGAVSYSWTDGIDSGSGLTIPLNGSSSVNINYDYSITATDAAGCTATDVINVSIESKPDVTLVITDNTCFVDGGVEFSFFNHPNRGAIEFSLDGGSSYMSAISDNSGSIFYDLDAGSYHAFSRWGNNECPIDLGTFDVLSDASALSIDVGNLVRVCEGESVTVSPSTIGGVSPFTYTWSDGTNSGSGLTFTPTGVSTNNVTLIYVITATDANGCLDTGTKQVEVRSLPTVSLIETVDACSGDGEVTLSFPNHPNRSAIEFSTDGGVSYFPQVADNSGSVSYPLAIGTYNLFVRWGNEQCPLDLGSFDINSLAIDLELGEDHIICNGEDITLSPTVTGGQAPYTYTWDNGVESGNGLIFTPSGSSSNNLDYSYVIRVTDANGCESQDDIEVSVKSKPTAEVYSALVNCAGDAEVVFTFPDHPNQLGIEFSLDGGSTYEATIFDNSVTQFYARPEGVYSTYVRWYDNSCEVEIGDAEIINADTYYSASSGMTDDPIWRPEGGTLPMAINFCFDRSLVITSGHTVTADKNIIADDIRIETGAELNMQNDVYPVELKGDFTCLGNYEAMENMISFTGVSSQLIKGDVKFHDVMVSNNSGVLLDADMTLNGAFYPEAGTFDTQGRNFVLTSELVGGAVQTGSISEIKAGADFLGDIKIERYVESLEDGYRLIGVPIINQTLSDFQGDFVTTGYPGSDWPSHYFTNVKYYDETAHLPNDEDAGFQDVVSSTDPVNSEKGYWAYFPPSTSANVLESTGEFKKGDITYNLTYTETGDDYYEGWHCIPNPYPSAIDLSSADIEFVNVDKSFYILDHTVGGNWKGEYIVYNQSGASINGATNVIASYQSFFVKANGPGASITFKETTKSNEQGIFYRNQAEDLSLLRFSMGRGDLKYETIVAFNENASGDYDPDYDSYKRGSTMFSMGTIIGEDTLSINTFSDYNQNLEIPVQIYAPEAGEYTFTLDAVQNIDNNLCLNLKDILTGESYPINRNEPISFSVDSDGFRGQRFVITSKPAAQILTESPTCANGSDAFIEVNPLIEGPYNFTLISEDGETITTHHENGNAILDGIPSGVYQLHLESEAENCGALNYDLEIWETPALPPSSVSYLKDHCDEDEGKIFISADHASEMTVQVYLDGVLVDETTGTELIVFQNLRGDDYHVEVITQCGDETHDVDIQNHSPVTPLFDLPETEELINGSATLELSSSSLNSLQDNWYLNGDWLCIGEECEVTFTEEGEYEITLESSDGNCLQEITKTISVAVFSPFAENTDNVGFAMGIAGNQLSVNQLRGERYFTRLDVFDVQGKLVHQADFEPKSRLDWDHSKLTSGSYVIRLSDKGHTVYKEIFVK